MQLIYRAQTYTFVPSSLQTESYPYAVNWRYQVPGYAHAVCQVRRSPAAINPRAVNWRYQVPGATGC